MEFVWRLEEGDGGWRFSEDGFAMVTGKFGISVVGFLVELGVLGRVRGFCDVERCVDSLEMVCVLVNGGV